MWAVPRGPQSSSFKARSLSGPLGADRSPGALGHPDSQAALTSHWTPGHWPGTKGLPTPHTLPVPLPLSFHALVSLSCLGWGSPAGWGVMGLAHDGPNLEGRLP